ncbi:MAG: Xaa-Pro peptidase family protein [Gemmatimonadota bacterium]
MVAGPSKFLRLQRDLGRIQEALREADLDGWLLYDLHARNTVTAKLTDLGDMSRRYFVLLPAHGDPHALVHGIEETPWSNWPWSKERYVGWRQLEEKLRARLTGKRVAMEISEGDGVPAMDLVPAGVLELIRNSGAQVVTSGELVTQFYSVWTDEELASHRRAAAILMQVANATFMRIAHALQAGETVTEAGAQAWVQADLKARGAGVGGDCIVASTVGAADPHYAPVGLGAPLRAGDLVLLDLWGKEKEESVYADQTWMAYLGPVVPDRARQLFEIIRDGRDAAVTFLQESWKAKRPVRGGEVDDVTRGLITDRGYGHAFIHRTGHSIDQSVHGMGPNIDNLETRDTRVLIPGVAFSIEPGIYLRGEIGMRTEINVFMNRNGPEVTVAQPQTEIFAVMP